MAGPVRRPGWLELRPDRRAAKFLGHGLLNKGDDGLLGAIVRVLEEEEGFRVVGADDVLGDLQAPSGAFGCISLSKDARLDVAVGVEVLRTTGPLDIGQAVIVQQGIVLGLEAAEGTRRLIQRCGDLHREGRGGVLVKLPKPGQETRADMPSIGSETIVAAAEAGLVGVAVAQERTLVLERDTVIREADARGIFVVGIDPAEFIEDFDAGK